MVYSMTGLGLAEAKKDGVGVNVEIRSVNNRFLDISCRLPQNLTQYEPEVRRIVRQEITRGKIYITISIHDENQPQVPYKVNIPLTKQIRSLLETLLNAANLDESPSLDHLLHFPELFESADGPESADNHWALIKEALTLALKDLKEMRLREGQTLAEDIINRINTLDDLLHRIESIARDHVQDAYAKLIQRIKTMALDANLDSERLNTEAVLMADRLDISEEIVRLRSHHSLFKDFLKQNDQAGKKLTFLLQEINREANTIASKATNAEISHLIVGMKDQIEQIREQVQNLE
ncbi:MAG TPA: YicC family protein [bacterium]|nr:YicC family protein [bacterium]